MDITQAAFGLDMHAASRIYFIGPVLNPQVEAQAIGRARRISQQKPVTVETLVLRGSVEELIVSRRKKMSQAEHRKCKSILDDRPLYEWIRNAAILPLPHVAGDDGPSQMAPLQKPLLVFGKGFGRIPGMDDGLVAPVSPVSSKTLPFHGASPENGIKRSFGAGPGEGEQLSDSLKPSKRRAVRFTVDDEDDN
jgi:hypothetical protein